MTIQIKKIDLERYYLIQNDTDVFLFGYVQEDRVLTSGQPYLETYLTEDELRVAVDAIKGSGHYENSKDEEIV